MIGFLLAAHTGSVFADQIVQLNAVRTLPMNGNSGSLLAREIARQALLIGARDELGAVTRDAVLREGKGAASPAIVVDMAVSVHQKMSAHIELTNSADHGKTVWSGDASVVGKDRHLELDYLAEVAACEAFSRQEFVTALKNYGVQGIAHPWMASAAAPADTEERLEQWNLLSQFALLREVHAAITAQGESPERLGALVRAYAQMGASARVLSGGEYAVFTARALLYAERLVGKDHGSAWSLWNRAYARAIAGFQGAALADLDAAQRAAGVAAPPDWVELVQLFCHYDTQKLLEKTDDKGPLSGVAGELAFLSVQNMNVDGYRMRVARQVLEDEVACDALGISEFMCDHSGPGWLNTLVDVGPGVMRKYLPYYLPKMADAPPAAVAQAQTTGDVDPNVLEEAVGRSLVAAKESSTEPSWGMLGRLLQEYAFAHVWRHAYLVAFQWGLPVGDYVQSTLPLVAEHPLKQLIAGMGPRPDELTIKFVQDDLPSVDLSPAALKFYYQLSGDRDIGLRVYTALLRARDYTAIDYEQDLALRSEASAVDPLFALSPDSPVAVAARIETNWDQAEETRKEWEPRLHGHPLVARAMAKHEAGEQQLLEANQWARVWVQGSPDSTAYHFLADLYDKQGKESEWKATLEEFLKKGDAWGLEAEQVKVQLAQRLMNEGNFEEAWPYASSAADSGASWAMNCAQGCAEGMSDWTEAEKWARADAEHYDNRASDWYFWCQRMGKGDLAAAKDYLKQQPGFFSASNQVFALAGYRMLEGDNGAAMTLLENRFPQSKDPWDGLHLALLYDAAGKTADRDRVLAATAEILPTQELQSFSARPQMIQLATLFQQCLRRNSTAAINARSASRFLKSAPGEESNLGYFLGRFLELHDRAEDAKTYYAQSVWAKNHRTVNMALSGARLRALGVDPISVRPAATTKPAAPNLGN
jgi:hypothetical protein